MMQKTIGIILAYNSGKTLEDLFKRIPSSALDDLILVDDGSTDDTMTIAKRLGIKSFTHEHRRYGSNLKFGLKKALELGGDYIFEIHGDNQYDPSSIIPALAKLRGSDDLVLGSRFTSLTSPFKDGMPLIKCLANRALSFIDGLVLRLPLTEFHTGFRGFSRGFLEKANFESWSDDYLFDFQTIVAAKHLGFKISEVPVRCIYHVNASSINLRRSFVYAVQTFVLLARYLMVKAGFLRNL